MTQPLFDTAPVYSLPLEKGTDLHFTMVYAPAVTDDDGNPIYETDDNGNVVKNPDGTPRKQYAEANWPAGSTVTVEIDTEPDPTVMTAVIDGSLATVHLDKIDADGIPSKLLWRAVLTHADGLDEGLAKGQTLRSDGK